MFRAKRLLSVFVIILLRIRPEKFSIQVGSLALYFSVRFLLGALFIEPSGFPHKFFVTFTAF